MTPSSTRGVGGHRGGGRLAPLVLAAALTAPDARAQCGAVTSSCRTCHEIEAQAPPTATAPWHRDHAFADFCSGCHGGVSTESAEPAAHTGLVDPFAASRCAPCHADASERAALYRRGTRQEGPPQKTPDRRPPGGDAPAHDAAFASLAALVLLAFLATVVWNERRRHRALAAASRTDRTPYVTGALLGVVAAASMMVFGHRLSGGGAYQQIAAPLGRLVAPKSVYFDHVIAGAARWELPALVGALLGAFVASRVSGTFRVRTLPDSGWREAFGPSVAKRWTIAFLGSALTELAAGVAGGCTASLAVSGGAALAPSAFLFMAGMFAGGIPTAWLSSRRRVR